MADCRKCTRTDVKCCYTCGRNSEECNVWHNCGEDCPKYIKEIQTNSQKIRAMSDEELAELFAKLAWNSEVQTTPLKYLEWLQSEAE